MMETTMQPSARRLGTAIALAALTLALVVPAQGQPAKPDAHSGHHPPGAAPAPAAPPMTGMPGDQRGMMPMMHGMMGGMMQGGGLSHMMQHHTEGTLAFLKAELQITTAQEAPWTAFADAARATVKKMPARPTARADAPASWPERLADREKALTAQLEALKTMQPAVAGLYAALSAEQKKKADALMAGGTGMRM
jgi:hypothetical protein